MNTVKLGQVNGEGFVAPVWKYGDKCFWVGDWDNDSDGPGGSLEDDPDWQPETSLKLRGQSINSRKVPGIVVPGWLPRAVGPIVLGCKGRVTDLRTGISIDVVVYDTGPKNKVGEGSISAAKLLGINPDSRKGGVDEPVILFECWPGVAALIEGILYELQHV